MLVLKWSRNRLTRKAELECLKLSSSYTLSAWETNDHIESVDLNVITVLFSLLFVT